MPKPRVKKSDGKRRVCPMCGLAKDQSDFYRTSSYCKPCHKQRSLQYRKQPARRRQELATRNAWLKRHPEVNRRNVAAWRARKKAQPPEQVVPTDRVLVQEAAARLGMTKQRVQQLIDRGQLPGLRVRGRWQVERVALEIMIQDRTTRREASPDPRVEED